MAYFDDAENVEQYIKSAEGYDGRDLLAVLQQYLKTSATILELGMGPGKDLDMLAQDYTVTGSDNSQPFIEHYLREHPDADVLILNAVTLDTKRHFDAVYSNKVLPFLSREQLRQSFQEHVRLLNPDGIALHSFSYGDKEEDYDGTHFIYYNESTLAEVVDDSLDIIDFQRYTEFEENDSFYVILRRKAMLGKVIAVSKSATHSLSKYNQESINLIPDWGVEGDAHAGKTVQHLYLIRTDPDRPNNRHVHLFLQEMLDELAEKGFALTPGQVGENVTTQGLPLLDMPVGTKLYIGEKVCLELTGLRDPCGQLNSIYPGLKAAMLDEDDQGNTVYRGGLYGVIRTGGIVKPGDAIRVELPPEPHKPMVII